MHPRLHELVEYIDRQAALLRSEYESVPVNERAVRPAPEAWSPAEVVHHVAIVERRLTSAIERMIAGARSFPPEREADSILARIDNARVEVRSSRIVTADANVPRDTNPESVLDEFTAARQHLKDVLATADGLDLSAVSAPHPSLGSMTGYEWVAFVGSHAARHAAQIRETRGG